MDDDQCSEAHGSEKDTFNGIEGPQARRMSHVRIDLAAAAAVGPMPALLTPDINCVLVVGDDGDDSGEEIHAGGAISWGGARGLPRGVSDDYDGGERFCFFSLSWLVLRVGLAVSPPIITWPFMSGYSRQGFPSLRLISSAFLEPAHNLGSS